MKAVRLTPDTPMEVRKRFPEDYEAIVKLPSLGRTITIPWIGKTKGGEQEIIEKATQKWAVGSGLKNFTVEVRWIG